MEIPFKNIKLPSFSDRQNNTLKISDLKDYYTWNKDIEAEIIEESEKRQKNEKDEKFEVEHSYFDFQYLIIGEKVRKYLGCDDKTDETVNLEFKFNDFELAKLLRYSPG